MLIKTGTECAFSYNCRRCIKLSRLTGALRWGRLGNFCIGKLRNACFSDHSSDSVFNPANFNFCRCSSNTKQTKKLDAKQTNKLDSKQTKKLDTNQVKSSPYLCTGSIKATLEAWMGCSMVITVPLSEPESSAETCLLTWKHLELTTHLLSSSGAS